MSSSLPANFRRNVLANYGTTLTLLVVALVTTPLLARHLGPERFGVWALIGAMIPYLELFEFGMADAAVTFAAGSLAEGDEPGVYRVLNTVFFLLMVPGAIAGVIAVALAVALPQIVHIPPHLVGQARALLLLMALDMVVSIPGDTLGGGLVALQRYDLLNTSLITVMVLQASAWVIVLLCGGGLVLLGIVTVAISLAGQLSRFVMLRRLLPDFVVSRRNIDRTLVRSLARLSGWFSVKQVADAVALACDVVITGIVVGVPSAGVYAVGQRLAGLGPGLVGPVVGVFFPHSADVSHRGEPGALRATVVTGTRLAMGLAIPVSLVLAIFADPALRAWVGPAFVQAATVVALLAAAAVVTSLISTGRTVLMGMGQPRASVIVSALATTTHIVLSVVLGQAIGITGVALGTLLAAIVFDGTVMLVLMCRHFELRPGAYLLSIVRGHLVPVVVAGAIGVVGLLGWVEAFVGSHGRILALTAVVGAAFVVLTAYGVIFLRTGVTKHERQLVLSRMRRLI